MKRLLFVDDEPRVLDGLRNMLRSRRREWDMVFVNSGEAALEAAAEQPFDVVVSDMRMRHMDGASLLKRIQTDYPRTVRIVLSGYSELEATLRTVPTAHQFISKPCEPDVLKNMLDRACALQGLLDSESLRAAIGGMSGLPTAPRLFLRLTQALEDPRIPVIVVADLIAQDLAMTAKVLQIVNSAFFGLAQRISNVHEAVRYLGLQMIKSLVLSVEVFSQFPDDRSIEACGIERLPAHSLSTAQIARGMFTERQKSDDAFTAGLLHDVGILALASRLREPFLASRQLVAERGCPATAAERETIGATHAEIGAYLLGLWGLPYPIVEAVAHHHWPQAVEHEGFDVVDSIRVAERLAYEVDPEGYSPCEVPDPLDPSYLAGLGVGDRLGSWRDLARWTVEQCPQEV